MASGRNVCDGCTSNGRDESMSQGMSRRRLLGAGAGMVGAAALGASPAAASGGGDGHGHGHHDRGRGGRLVPRDRLGVQQWSVRDATPRLGPLGQRLSGRPRLPRGPDRSGAADPASGRLCGGLRVPRERRLPRLRVLHARPGGQRPDHSAADPPSARRRGSRLGRQPPGRPAIDGGRDLPQQPDPDRGARSGTGSSGPPGTRPTRRSARWRRGRATPSRRTRSGRRCARPA